MSVTAKVDEKYNAVIKSSSQIYENTLFNKINLRMKYEIIADFNLIMLLQINEILLFHLNNS